LYDFLPVRSEYSLQNKVLRISGRKTEEIIGDWRTLHSDELLNLCLSNITIKGDERKNHVARVGEEICAYINLKGKPE
jgi:hypothetical protein